MTTTPAQPPKLRPLHMRLPVFVVVVAGCALVFWAWKYNRENRDVARASMSLELNKLARDTDPKVRHNAALVLGDVTPKLAAEAVEPLLLAATRDPAPSVRVAAARALIHVLSGQAWERSSGDMAAQVDRALPVLVGLLDDHDATVRAETATAVGTTIANLARTRGGEVDKEMALVTKALLKTIRQDSDPNVRIAAVDALIAMRVTLQVPANHTAAPPKIVEVMPDPSLVTPALQEVLVQDLDASVRYAVVRPLIAFHPVRGEVPPALLKELGRKHDPTMALVILVQLISPNPAFVGTARSWSNSDALWPIVVDLLVNGSEDERFGAASLMRTLSLPPASIVPSLVDLLPNPNIPSRDELALMLLNSRNKPGADVLRPAAEVLGKDTLRELPLDIYGSAMILSILRVETEECPKVRQVLVSHLRRAMKETDFRTDPGSSMTLIAGDIINTEIGPSTIAGILANFGPAAGDVVPELVNLFSENPTLQSRDTLAGIFLRVGPAAREALPALKARAEAETHLRSRPPESTAQTFSTKYENPDLVYAEAMFSIDPRAAETRSLVVPMAVLAQNGDDTSRRQAARSWLEGMIQLDSSLIHEIEQAASSSTEPQIRAALLGISQALSQSQTSPEGGPSAR